MELPDVIQERGLAEGLKAAFKILEAVAGPPSKAVGELAALPFVAARAELLVRFARRYKAIVKECGIDERQVPLKIWFPIVQEASLEEDTDMQERWAALLANAANPSAQSLVRPAFAEILKELSPNEAKWLERLYGPEFRIEANDHDFRVTLDNLDRLNVILVELHSIVGQPGARDVVFQGQNFRYNTTPLGEAFLAACRKPRKKGSAKT